LIDNEKNNVCITKLNKPKIKPFNPYNTYLPYRIKVPKIPFKIAYNGYVLNLIYWQLNDYIWILT